MSDNVLEQANDGGYGIFASALPASYNTTTPVISDAPPLATGTYEVACYGIDGELKWSETSDNVVTTLGKCAALEAIFSDGQTAPSFIGLISNVSFSAVSASDSMSGGRAWIECGGINPPQSGNRPTCSWTAAAGGSKVMTPASVNFSSAGSVAGVFLVFGFAASATPDTTTGVLYSCSTFAAPRTVIATDHLTISYTASL